MNTLSLSLIATIEAVLFASGEPMLLDKLTQVCAVEKQEVLSALEVLKKQYDSDKSGLKLLQLGKSYQISTKPEFAPYIKEAIEIKRQTPLSAAAMEVLAIIAYNQPVSKAFVEQVRGIDSSSVVNTLNERGLVEEAGRLDLPGRPIAYRTTENFLRCFGLTKLSELPPLPDENEQLTLHENTGDVETENDSGETDGHNDFE
ncbi:MAG: SMC-Scp complex subunit ScpB [Oscillospiraceae bacterium]|nr:SMC-Scp complex subunit ScpB [Oscillospiraceae bacterium]